MSVMKCTAAAALASLALLLSPSAINAAYYPNTGDLCYDGFFFADSFLLWSSPGPWTMPTPNISNDPGYEHDLAVRSHFFQACTTWTNLPSGYDDCPTAGVSEPGDLWTFSFGSFHATSVAANTWYYGSWNFSGGSSTTSDFLLNGQEVWHGFCPVDSIWCMNARRSENLLSDFMDWAGIPSCLAWSIVTDDDDDGDGLLDLVETGTGIYVSPSNTGTNPLNPDSDGDGFNDGLEVLAGSNPNNTGDVPPDTDADAVPNVQDNCTLVANPIQLDANSEGFGNICDADITDDGLVGGSDWLIFVGSCFGMMVGPGACGCVEDPTCGESDFTGDGVVGGSDYLIFGMSFGMAPGPSGLLCAGTIPCP